MFTVVVEVAVRLRSSVAVPVTVTDEPGCAPVVFSVAVLPVPEMFPAEAEYVTVTCRLSGLLALQLMVEVPPGWTVVGLAEHEIVGGLGCFTVKFAVQVAVSFFLPVAMFEVTV